MTDAFSRFAFYCHVNSPLNFSGKAASAYAPEGASALRPAGHFLFVGTFINAANGLLNGFAGFGGGPEGR